MNQPGNSSIRDLPDFNITILWAWGNHIIIVRAEGNIEDRPLVPGNQGGIWGNSTSLNKKVLNVNIHMDTKKLLRIAQSVYLPVLSICPFIWLFISVYLYLFIYMYIRLSICLPIYQSICLSYLNIFPSVYLI